MEDQKESLYDVSTSHLVESDVEQGVEAHEQTTYSDRRTHSASLPPSLFTSNGICCTNASDTSTPSIWKCSCAGSFSSNPRSMSLASAHSHALSITRWSSSSSTPQLRPAARMARSLWVPSLLSTCEYHLMRPQAHSVCTSCPTCTR